MNSNSSSNNNQKNISISDRQTKNNQEKKIKDNISPVGSPFSTNTNLNYAINNTIKCTRKKNNSNKVSKSQKPKKIKNKYQYIAYTNLSKKYNFTLKKYNLLCINYLLSNKSCRLVSIFKEKMITDYIDEFLKRKYSIKESEERIPKFYLYYKHYSIFFGQPFFTDFSFNILLQKNGEKKARIYYKKHYQNGESKDEDNENIGFAESGSDEDDEDKKNDDTNKKKKNKNNTIFSEGIKDNIDNITVMTTINSIENNTINLGLNNEKIEIFSENKMEKSNDTTIGELMDDINKGIEESNRAKNNNLAKKKKEKHFSLGDNFYNLIKKNNNNTINDNIKKNKKKLIELINNSNNMKSKIKNNSIKKKLFYVGHKNANLYNNAGFLTSNTQRYNHKKNSISIKGENLNKKNNTSSNRNLNSNKAYKKRKLLSHTNEEVNKLINPNYIYNPKSPRHVNSNINGNYLNTINANPVYGCKKLNDVRKINSPIQINKKINSINTNSLLTSLNNNHTNNKIKICKTLKSFVEQNKNKTKKNVTKNIINKNIGTISGERKKKINKISFKKFDIDNLAETQIFKEKHINKKVKGRNILSPLNNKYFENYTLTNEYTNITNNIPFSANKNKNSINNNKIFNKNAIFNNLSYQTINYEQGIGHQRTKSNLVQNNVKKNNNFTKIINTEMNNAYIKPAIRIKKNDKLYMSRPILNDNNIDNNYENKTAINSNNIFNSKKLSNNNNGNYLTSNCVMNNISNNEVKNNFNNNNVKNTNYNNYILEVFKKYKHQHYNSLTNQINPRHTLNSKDTNKKKLNMNNIKDNKDQEVWQIALSLLLNHNNNNNSSNNQNQTNIIEPSNNNNNINNYNTYCKINNNNQQIQPKNQNNNNNKRNYNLNININNEININENNTINNSTYINHTHRLNNKNVGGTNKNVLNNYFGDNSKQKEKNKYIINLKQKKYNIEPALASNRTNNCQSTKNNNTNNDNHIINLNNKKGKKIKTRNNINHNLNNALTTNNNLMKTVIVNNNSIDNSKSIHNNKNNMNNIKNSNTIKSYHTKSVTSLSDLMYHNKKLISLYKNLSKSK